MSSCAACGHRLGLGRFCTNCGAPADPATPDDDLLAPPGSHDWRTDTAERTTPRLLPPDLLPEPATQQSPIASEPRLPPSAVTPPPPPRYPLFADEVQGPLAGPAATAVSEQRPNPSPVPGFAGQPPPADHDVPVLAHGGAPPPWADQADEERRTPLPWLAAAVAVVLLALAGWWYLARDDGASGTDAPGSASSGQAEETGTDVAGRATARAPSTAPPTEDVNGDQISYDASNMLDGVPETAWRTPGDGTGVALRFTLAAPTRLTEVGLVNGYAKTSTDGEGRAFDWYLGNRRVEAVVWVFDDGTKVRQQLEEDRALQSMPVEAVTTRKVVVRLVRVSAPGSGAAARDFTAVSEVSLVGVPQTG